MCGVVIVESRMVTAGYKKEEIVCMYVGQEGGVGWREEMYT
jgi:hypothetical protein